MECNNGHRVITTSSLHHCKNVVLGYLSTSYLCELEEEILKLFIWQLLKNSGGKCTDILIWKITIQQLESSLCCVCVCVCECVCVVCVHVCVCACVRVVVMVERGERGERRRFYCLQAYTSTGKACLASASWSRREYTSRLSERLPQFTFCIYAGTACGG